MDSIGENVGEHIGKRIREQRKKLGLTGIKIKELTKISTGTLSDIENGNTLPTAPSLMKLSQVLNCSVDWILFGKSMSSGYFSDNREKELLDNFSLLPPEEQEELIGIVHLKVLKEKKKKDSLEKSPNGNINVLNDDFSHYNVNHSVSILGYVAAGEPILSYENEINTIVPESDKVSYALIAKGNSMEPIILDGEIIEVISQSELENGEIGIIKVDNAVTCKCFYSMSNRYELKSLNPDIDPIIISKNPKIDIHIIGKVALTNIQQLRYNSYFKIR